MTYIVKWHFEDLVEMRNEEYIDDVSFESREEAENAAKAFENDLPRLMKEDDWYRNLRYRFYTIIEVKKERRNIRL